MDTDNEEIYEWIDGYKLSRLKKNINRDFSDAVPLAEILKQHFPKLVELHNYSPKNSFAQKLSNWNILQWKVLSKLKINLSKNTLEDLARAEVGAIEKVLAQVKAVIEKLEIKDKADLSDVYYMEGFDGTEAEDDVMPIKMKLGSKISDKKIVSSYVFDDMVKSLTEKDEMIGNLNNKVEHLEKMISIKEERIADLQAQVKSLMIELDNHPTSRFLNDIF